MQRTLAILKPDIVAHPFLVDKVMQRIQESAFLIHSQQSLQWSLKDAEGFYAEHKGKFFYQRLCEYMTGGEMIALVLQKENSIKEWRNLIGPTHPVKAKTISPTSLRGIYGLTDTRNSFHGSDSETSAEREIKYFF